MTIHLTPKNVLAGVLLVAMTFAFTACNSTTSSDQQTSQQVNTQQGIYNQNQPIHQYDYSNERAELQAIYDARVAGNVDTWSVWISNNGVPLGMCPSKGFPLPYSVELTNPQVVQYGNSVGTGVISQADPNGLYPTGSTMATWVMCLNTDGTSSPVYVEPMVITYTYAVKIVNGIIVPVGSTDGSVKVKGVTSNPKPVATPGQ